MAGARAFCDGLRGTGRVFPARYAAAAFVSDRFGDIGCGGAGNLDRAGSSLASLSGCLAFQNSITGIARSTLPVSLKANGFFIAVRVLESAILIPIVEELFWRGWLMRWTIRPDFENVPVGQYTPFSFCIVALLFASEHGPYWDVGLVAGVAYNWWMVRTRNLSDCMLAHGVTNALLAAYVLWFDQWQYWM